MSKKKALAMPLETLSAEDQVKVLDEGKASITREAWFMKRCLDSGKLMDALKHASTMICELRESRLSPKNYYELYITAFDEMRYLESYLSDDEKTRGRSLSELYELVQYAGNILPRLYLMVTVGSVYIKERQAPAKDVLRDLVEMCRGIQHPTRGLFLRNYLSEMTKDKLPDVGSEFEGKGGSVQHSIVFTLQNFVEMNKLWVRMQHQGAAKNREKREEERKALRLLVGKNLARLSQLDGVDAETYESVVLHRVLEQIVSCRDQIAQHYLMEVVIQVFPDEFHLLTLEKLLETCCSLLPSVNVRAIICALMDRLAAFAQRSPTSITAEMDIFEVFERHARLIIARFTHMPLEDILAIYASLSALSIALYPDRTAHMDTVFDQVSTHVERLGGELEDGKSEAVKLLLRVVRQPLEAASDITVLLHIDGFARTVNLLGYRQRKAVALEIVRQILHKAVKITKPDTVERLFGVIRPLVADEEGQDALDEEDHEEEQGWVAAMVPLLVSPKIEEQFVIYGAARKVFGQGGSTRIKYTLPPLVFGALQLVQRLRVASRALQAEEWSKAGMRIFKFIHETISALSKCGYKQVSLSLFLEAACSASQCQFEAIAYEFIIQVFDIYESDIADSQTQYTVLLQVIGALRTLDVFSNENYDAFITKTAIHAGKLIKRPDQCRAVYHSAYLFWVDGEGRNYRDAKRVLECLQRALKIAAACVDPANIAQLFVELLNQYLYFFEAGNELVVVKFVKTLVALADAHVKNVEGSADVVPPEVAAGTKDYYRNTLHHIAAKKAASTDSPYHQI